jgi:hypothetical protein
VPIHYPHFSHRQPTEKPAKAGIVKVFLRRENERISEPDLDDSGLSGIMSQTGGVVTKKQVNKP